jgi:hypothetical protein
MKRFHWWIKYTPANAPKFHFAVDYAKTACVEVNGRWLEGKTVQREQAGLTLSSAFLYLSETWAFPD